MAWLRYARSATPDKRRPGQIPGRTPGPSLLARHGARVRAVFMPAICGVVQCDVRGAWGQARTVIGCTVAGAVRSKGASVAAVIAATSTALPSARGFDAVSRCGGPVPA